MAAQPAPTAKPRMVHTVRVRADGTAAATGRVAGRHITPATMTEMTVPIRADLVMAVAVAVRIPTQTPIPTRAAVWTPPVPVAPGAPAAAVAAEA